VILFVALSFTAIWKKRRELHYSGYYAASSGNFLLMFRDNTMIPSSRVKSFRHFGRRREENYALLGYHAASSGNSIQMYQNQTVSSSRVKTRRAWRRDRYVVPKCWSGITTTCCVIAQ